jgi:hypothetical protein
MDSSSCDAHAYMLGARFGVRAAEDGHLTLLSAHGCMKCMGAEEMSSVVAFDGACGFTAHGCTASQEWLLCCVLDWLLLLPPTQCVQMPH